MSGILLEGLLADGLDWLLDTSFLGRLGRYDQEAVLFGGQIQDFAESEVVIAARQPGQYVDLIVAGQATVAVDDADGRRVIARVGPGHLIGERAVRRSEQTFAEVTASSPMRTLRFPAEHFRKMLGAIPDLASYVDDLIALRDRSSLLLSLLLREPILRSLGRDGIERLLQSGALQRFGAGDRIVTAGERGGDVYLVVKGRLAVYAPTANGGREHVTSEGPGWLFGHASVLLDMPRTADIEAELACELLRVSARAFVELIARNPPLYRRLYQHLASMDLRAQTVLGRSRQPMVFALWSGHRDIGTTTLAYGTAAVFAQERGVTLVDMGGAGTAQRLQIGTWDETVGDIAVRRLATPAGWPFRVIWPERPDQLTALVAALRDTGDGESVVIAVLDEARSPSPETVELVETVVYVRWARDTSTGLALSHLGYRVDAVRIEEGHELPLATNRNAVRIPPDKVTPERFWRTGELGVFLGTSAPLGRACQRLTRVLTGRTVGVALGGGGALGFAHIALLEVLEAEGIPVDYVAGVSFGSVVGALYASGGLSRCRELLERRKALRWLSGAAMLSLKPLTMWVDRLSGGQALGTTEIPFFPVALDVVSGDEVVITRGSVADGMCASSSFPGIFPATRRGGRRLVDGGIINNVPASVVWDAGADFIIASNIIPPHPVGRTPVLGVDLMSRLRSTTVARIDDMLRSVFLLMSQTGRDRATLADYVFDLDIEGYNLYDFHRGDAIYAYALERIQAALPDIRHARDSDRSMRIGRR